MPTLAHSNSSIPLTQAPCELNELSRSDNEALPYISPCIRDAIDVLHSHPMLSGRTLHVTCSCDGRILELTGQLPSFYLKQLAQESLRPLATARGLGVCNRIVVTSTESIATDTNHVTSQSTSDSRNFTNHSKEKSK